MALFYTLSYLALLGILSHVLGEAIPRQAFDPQSPLFRTWRWERDGRIYDRLKIRKWKHRLPDMSRMASDMVPKRLGVAPSAADVRRLIRETCRAEAVHLALMLLSPTICFFWKSAIGILLAVLYALGNLPFVLIQRYNRPRLTVLAARLEAREEKHRARENSDSVGKHGKRSQCRGEGNR